MRSRAAVAMLPLLVVATACGDRSDIDFGGRDIGADLFSVVSTDGAVRLALTHDYVYLTLADETRDEVRGDLRAGADQDGAGGRIASFVERTVGKALEFRALYPVDDVEDIYWRDGAMHIEFASGRKRDVTLNVGDQPVQDAFDEESVEAFSAALHALKRSRDGARR